MKKFQGSTHDLIDQLNKVHGAYTRYCNACGQPELRWARDARDGRWVLVNQHGQRHFCDGTLYKVRPDRVIHQMQQSDDRFERALGAAFNATNDEDQFKRLKRAFEDLWLRYAEQVEPDAVGTARKARKERPAEEPEADDDLPF